MKVKIWECAQRVLMHEREDGTKIYKRDLNLEQPLFQTLNELLPGDYLHFIHQVFNNGFNTVEMIHIVETYTVEGSSLTAFEDSFFLIPHPQNQGYICSSSHGYKQYHFHNGVQKEKIDVHRFAEWYLQEAKEDFLLHNIISVRDAATLMKYVPGTVKNMCANGEVKAKKLGNTWIINKLGIR